MDEVLALIGKAVEGDVVSLIQLFLFLFLFRDRLGGHSLSRDIGAMAAQMQTIQNNLLELKRSLPDDGGKDGDAVSKDSPS